MRSAIALLACLAVGLGAACGGGNHDSKPRGAEPEAWTHSWCVALRGFQNDSLARTADLRRRFQDSASAAQARAEIVDYYADTVLRIDRFLDDLQRLGVPAVQDGSSLVNSTITLYGRFRLTVARARERAKGLPSDPEGFTAENRRIARSVLVASHRLTRELGAWDDEHPTSEVETAYKKDAECRRLRAVK